APFERIIVRRRILDKGDNTIVNDADKLALDAVDDPLNACFLDLADAPGLDVILVDDGYGPKHAPGGAIIGGLAQEKVLARSEYRPVLLMCLICWRSGIGNAGVGQFP